MWHLVTPRGRLRRESSDLTVESTGVDLCGRADLPTTESRRGQSYRAGEDGARFRTDPGLLSLSYHLRLS